MKRFVFLTSHERYFFMQIYFIVSFLSSSPYPLVFSTVKGELCKTKMLYFCLYTLFKKSLTVLITLVIPLVIMHLWRFLETWASPSATLPCIGCLLTRWGRISWRKEIHTQNWITIAPNYGFLASTWVYCTTNSIMPSPCQSGQRAINAVLFFMSFGTWAIKLLFQLLLSVQIYIVAVRPFSHTAGWTTVHIGDRST